MTTDFTELAQSHELLIANGQQTADLLRHLANNEIDSDHFAVTSECEGYGTEVDAELSITEFALRAAGYVDALLEALEKAQQRIAEAESFRTAYMEWSDKTDWVNTDRRFGVVKPLGKHRADVLKAYIEHLESRTVTVKQGEVLVTVAGFTGCGKSAIAGEIEIAMKAIGVPVTWANGDAEKRMTGADWLTAIEMYKPTVRIVEGNIPRAAGIKWEAE
ncbi:ead/Ea22-like family protein [Klebsiella huaxiensis]|uniref:Ead/Ea22-like family protein n=1 Tax=Klebsiella huaxiensis TaxID=2153354 RepID=A0A564M6D1_9ENTR|nr:ead/Ea22-like family protein [Klebsiella huaxiensis]VUS89364.1 hypothetical protein SB6422_02798 [Klebsiella huaxiensis]